MGYNLIDKVIAVEKARRENNRLETLSHVKELLARCAPKYSFSQAYIFGSLVKHGRFRPESDVDLALFGLSDGFFFALMAEASRELGRDVDLYQIEKMDKQFRTRIEAKGVLWMKPDLES